ncbi:MAG: hypothetical protein AAF515_05825 [Pseudomonadota bacterium]
MRIVLIAIGGLYLAFAALQVPQLAAVGKGWLMGTYLLGAGCTAAALSGDGLPRPLVRLLAVIAMCVMFLHFFGFFKLAPLLHADWWQKERALESVGLLFGAFAMIPVLACLSCRLKALPKPQADRSPAVFSAPGTPSVAKLVD